MVSNAIRNVLRSTAPALLAAAGAVCLPAALSAQEVLHTFVGDLGIYDTWFYEFDTVGDVNGDHVPDFIYGCPGPHMHVVRSGSDWSVLARYQSTYSGGDHDSHGVDVAGIGFWDDDEIPDYAVGAPGVSLQQYYEGAVRVFSGATHTMIQEISEHVYYERMGRNVYGLGDVDGDGYTDLATIGVNGTWVRIYSGPDGSLLRSHELTGAFEPAVAQYGDHDGDGGLDYLIGRGGYSSSTAEYCGRVTLISGKTGTELLSMTGLRPHEGVGESVAAAGDWNGDGIDDIVAGAPGGNDSGGSICGVYIFSGAGGSILQFLDGADYAHPEAAFGFSVASGQDVNGDDFPDLLVGAPGKRGGPNNSLRIGAVYLFSGKTGSLLWVHHGRPQSDYKLGRYLYMIDDHDGDDLDEWVVSDPEHRIAGSFPVGRITIYKGSTGDVESGCPTSPNSSGPGARLQAVGPISLRDNLLELFVGLAPPLAAGMFVYGEPSSGAPFGDGNLCVSGTLISAGYLTMNANGAGLLPLDLFHAPFAHGPGALDPGDTRSFQYLYRDPGTGDRNASDSIVIQFVP